MIENQLIDRVVGHWNELNSLSKRVVALPPKTLMLEVTNACNLKCIMCTNPNMKRTKGTMPLSLAKKAIKEAAEMGVQEVALFTTGESLLYKDLTILIEEAKGHGLYCYLTSNGLLLNRKKCIDLCRAGLDSIKISVDGSNQEEYERIRLGGDFSKLIKNIRLLRDIRDKLGSGMCISVSAVLLEENEKSVANFKSYFKNLADEILISPLSNQGGKVDRVNISSFLNSEQTSIPCNQLWERIVVTYTGEISVCCIDFEAELIYGDLRSSSLEKIWNSESMQNIRRNHLTNNLEANALCRNCNYPYICDAEELIKLNS